MDKIKFNCLLDGWSVGASGIRQRGVSLVIAMVFLLILTILGLVALRVATLEERMSGNARERGLAFQAAEAALRDAEADIECTNASRNGAPVKSRAVGCISGASGADANCTGGLCCNLSGIVCGEPTSPVHEAFSMSAAPSVQYGEYTGATAINGVAAQPRYLIEPFMFDGKSYYRITARGYGLNSETTVTLQEIYHKE